MDRKEELKTRLVKDLGGFADTDSAKASWRTNSELVVSWEREGKRQNQCFKLGRDAMSRSGAVLHPMGENGPTTYPEFIRGVANLNHLSKSMIRSAEKDEEEEKDRGTALPYYVSTKALVEKDREGGEELLGNSDDLLLQEIKAAVKGEFVDTPVFFVKGDAGAGKTILLKRFRIQQARDFANGKANFLFLYVSAQGRSLSRLDDAIAGELGKLRAAFSADAVPALVRNKLLVPIVDGFDELLGSQGYSSAFSSLKNLLNELEGDGAMVVSARSAFYEAEFLGAMSEEDQGEMQVVPVSLLPWEDGEISQFLSGVRGTSGLSSSDSEALKSLPPQDRNLLGKPFFTARFPDYLDKGKGGGKGFLEFLVDAFIERESEKIVGDNDEPLLAPDKHQSVFLEIAEAMWARGERDLDRGDLEDIAAIALCDLSEETVDEFKKKIASYGGMKAVREGAAMKFRFEHEVYFEHFLSLMIRGKLREGLRKARVPTTLNSGILPAVATRLAVWDAEMHEACLQLVSTISENPLPQDEKIKINLGQMLASSFAVRGEQGIVSQDITVRGIKFRKCAFEKAHLQNVRFVDCAFSEVDMVGSTLEQCEAESCYVEGPLIVSKDTRLGIEGLVPGKNIFALTHKYEEGEIWDPEQIFQIMQCLGAILPAPVHPSYSEKAQNLIKLLRRFILAYRNRRALCEQDGSLGFFQSPHWRDLRELLLKHKIISKETKHPSGSPKTVFYRERGISSMLDVLKYEVVPECDLPKGKIMDLWRDLREMK